MTTATEVDVYAQVRTLLTTVGDLRDQIERLGSQVEGLEAKLHDTERRLDSRVNWHEIEKHR